MDQQMGLWIPGNVPPDESYWEALLQDGENGLAAPSEVQTSSWHVDEVDAPEKPAPANLETANDGWHSARKAMEEEESLELSVVGCNRGGVLVGWNGLCGFVPASHLLNLSSLADENKRYDELQNLVGNTLCLKIIELDPERNRFVLSERASHLDESRRQDLLDTLCPGDICQGRVTNLCSFGAFVDLGGLEGLVHVSELSWGRVEHPSDVLESNQTIEVYVLNVDRNRGRVGLSIKRLQPDPWQLIEERYRVGQIIQSTITHVVDFGAFAWVEDGVEGLIHVSELAEKSFTHPQNVVQENDVVTVRIINIDGERRRMGLSLRQVND